MNLVADKIWLLALLTVAWLRKEDTQARKGMVSATPARQRRQCRVRRGFGELAQGESAPSISHTLGGSSSLVSRFKSFLAFSFPLSPSSRAKGSRAFFLAPISAGFSVSQLLFVGLAVN